MAILRSLFQTKSTAPLCVITLSLLLLFTGTVKAQDVIKIGISTSFRPFNYIDENGDIRGYNADVARAICEKMQAQCEFIQMPFPKIIPALERNDIQMAASSLLFTEERARRINFTDKYFRSTTSLVGHSRDSFKDPAELLQENHQILVTLGSAQWQYLNEHTKAQPIAVKTQKEALQGIQQGKADFILLPTLFALNFLQQPENSYLDFIGLPVNHPSLEGDVHMGLSKAHPELQVKANSALQQLVDSGELRRLIDQYFPFNVY